MFLGYPGEEGVAELSVKYQNGDLEYEGLDLAVLETKVGNIAAKLIVKENGPRDAQVGGAQKLAQFQLQLKQIGVNSRNIQKE